MRIAKRGPASIFSW